MLNDVLQCGPMWLSPVAENSYFPDLIGPIHKPGNDPSTRWLPTIIGLAPRHVVPPACVHLVLPRQSQCGWMAVPPDQLFFLFNYPPSHGSGGLAGSVRRFLSIITSAVKPPSFEAQKLIKSA